MNMFSPTMAGRGRLHSETSQRMEAGSWWECCSEEEEGRKGTDKKGCPVTLSIEEVELLSRFAADWRGGRETDWFGKDDGPGLLTDCAIIELDEAPSLKGIFLEATSFS